MQHVNNDMDDLFRRAGENYPLKTNNPAWDALRKKLNPAEEDQNHKTADSQYKKGLFLLLLLIVPWICNKYNVNNSHIDDHYGIKESSGNLLYPLSDANKPITVNQFPIGEVDHPKAFLFPLANSAVPAFGNSQRISTNNKQEQFNGVNIPFKSSSLEKTNSSGNLNNQTLGHYNHIYQGIPPYAFNSGLLYSLTTILSPPLKSTQNLSEPINANKENAGKKAKPAPGNLKSSHYFYGGFTFAPDISTIKMQAIKNIGLNFGATAGYQFSKKLSLESGILWDKKFYYTDGKHFNTSKILLPPSTIIQSVDGQCRMLEIPINMKYNFINKLNHSWYALAGASTYLMKNENYNYYVLSSNMPYQKAYAYDNKTNYFLSVINLGLGYTHKIKTNTLVRIEPYVKIPLRGFGIGSLPISGTGVNLMLIKNFTHVKRGK